MDTIDSTEYAAALRQHIDALGTSPHREVERVNRVKETLAQGNYDVNPECIAEKLLAFERALVSDTIK